MSTSNNSKNRNSDPGLPNTNKTRTLGPVADLEKHLPTDWWRTLFNSLYLKTDGDVFENDTNTRDEIDMLLQAIPLTPNHHILDLCCGQGRHTLELYQRGFHNIVGIDRSRYLIRTAKKRAQQLGLLPRFSEGDVRKIRLPESSIDCIVMFGNSFGYFEQKEDDVAVLKSILRTLKSQGKILLDIVDGEWLRQHFEPRSWEWIDQNHFVCRERSLSKNQTRVITREVITHAERGVIADQFYAERIYTFAELESIFAKLNFSDIVLHHNIKANSTREQDLGMMANRMFISATAPAKVNKPTQVAATKSILVLLGDPRLSDSVRLHADYNEEEMITIDRMKQALKQLPQFKFHFFDHHQKLFDYLRQNRPEFVLNFCDEGFDNEATQELHVPALLEMLKIPYSGSAPACLGICYNKSFIRAIAHSLDIPVPLETYYDPTDQAATLPSIFPAILKPNYGDSSIGITKDAVVHNSEGLVSYLNQLRNILPNTPILVQEYLTGAEYSVGIIGNIGNLTIMPILAVDYSQLPADLPQILSYDSKWNPLSPYWTDIKYIEANLSSDSERQLIDYSLQLFDRLGCRDYARFDFRTDANGVIKLLEVNPNPAWCWDGKLNLMAGFCNKSYPELLQMIIDAALERVNNNQEQGL